MLRQRCNLSIRQLADLAGVTAGMISCIERDKNSPSIATLQKILTALNTDLASFFGGDPAPEPGPVFVRQKMKIVSDEERSYTIVFPRHKDIAVEMMDEQLLPKKRRPPYEELDCDVAGYLIGGSLILEVQGEPQWTLRPGDAFYIPRGHPHRGYAIGEEPARLITVCSPARY
jgi:HTH-type transcriptional repressor of puuD